MGRRRTKPLYLIVEAEILASVGEDRKLDPEGDSDNNLLDELQCPLFDEVLIALRKSFSLTFPRNPFIDGLLEALLEIRRICIEALRTIPEVLEELNLKPVPPPSEVGPNTKAYVFQYTLARFDDLQLKVKYNGKTQKLVNLIEQRPADEVIRALRDTVSYTFEEMYNEEQHEEALRQIRMRIGKVLPPLNELLVSIEIEPIADTTLIESADRVHDDYQGN
ncbi:hypothetical protein [Gimesia sp.]|uniref:hypothetical protein n=1 Tax=Gimesia sp. TaxID=2024833 RepID=UPI000C35DFFE|nr:hypothetical protein [Gimesia sp.]MAX35812.1 hypothetical protein [Gimesia sp.]HAH48882.1 hypothetical protein [Planctomycetaceae bacterium]|tara:strand:+ start:8910 stop:9572 length:663 start_codon:yes stop_codon:yes gene_type:complete